MTLEPHIKIEFGGHSGRFRPGEILRCEYWIEHLPQEQFNAVEISVLWRTEGKGDEDLGVHFFKRINAGEGDYFDPVRAIQFSTRLPDSPLSYSGVLIKIHWCVRVRAFISDGKELVCDREFRLGDVEAPQPREIGNQTQVLAY